MKMGAAVTMLSMAVQAVGALVLIITLARLLPPAEFAPFSIAFGTAQFAANLAFEWVRLAAMRYYPGPPEETAMRLANIRSALAVSAAGLLAVFTALTVFDAPIAGLTPRLFLAVMAIAVLQGLTDILFTTIRFSGRLILCGLLQILRSLSLVCFCIYAALSLRFADAALSGLVLGYLVALALSLVLFPDFVRVRVQDTTRTMLRALALQGMPAAAASQVHFAVTYGIRIIGASFLGVGSVMAAGFLLALDIIQRPFPLLGTLMTVLFVPDLNKAFDAAHTHEVRRQLTLQYDLLTGFSIIGGAALYNLLPVLAIALVDADLTPAFLTFATPLIVYFGGLLALQTTLALVPQVTRKTRYTLYRAAMHLALAVCFLLIARSLGLSWIAILWLAPLTVLLPMLIPLPRAPAVTALSSLRSMLVAGLFAAILVATKPLLSDLGPVVHGLAGGAVFLLAAATLFLSSIQQFRYQRHDAPIP